MIPSGREETEVVVGDWVEMIEFGAVGVGRELAEDDDEGFLRFHAFFYL